MSVRDFIQENVSAYEGDGSFLHGPTENTIQLWNYCSELLKEERGKGILDVAADRASNILAHDPGYIQKDLEKIVGLQTDAPLKRPIMPFGGLRTTIKALQSYGRDMPGNLKDFFQQHVTTHNDGVFSSYTPTIRECRRSGIITGLPDAYGRGRIIGDYRRVALYGTAKLIENKQKEKTNLSVSPFQEKNLRLIEEIHQQIQALQDLQRMAEEYGFDISIPAKNAHQAIQWTYFGYLGAVKEQDGAAMSLGRVASFFDIYIQEDLEKGLLDESQAQELVDHFVMKLRLVRFLRTPEYNELFSGDPTWVTEALGGMGQDKRTLVTKTSFRFLQTLYNLGPAPEPNLTVLWSPELPQGFKDFCSKVSIDTSSIQYENDDLMRPLFGDDYGIACCVSAMEIGKQMQFFGARANLAKALLYAINHGCDEITGKPIVPGIVQLKGDALDFDPVWNRFENVLDWLAEVYIDALNIIHFMHDRYAYERMQMALHDAEVLRTMACGIAGLSVVTDSLSAIKYAQVTPVRNEQGIAEDFSIEGEFPHYGNNDSRADELAQKIVSTFMDRLRRQKTYRDSKPTMSILTITSNVVYGKKTGSTPDGRKKGEPFAPGANPMHKRDVSGALAALQSVAKLPYKDAEDGISYTFSIFPSTLGKNEEQRITALSGLLDGYFAGGGHHININALDREVLLDAMENPENYPQLTIRVSGYAVNFIKLTREQQKDVISRTFHSKLG